MTPLKGNSEGETVSDLVNRGMENTAVKVAARVVIVVVLPLLGILAGDILQDFRDELRKIRETQNEQIDIINSKLDQASRDLQDISNEERDRNYQLQIQLKAIEEILRNKVLKEEQSDDPYLFKDELGAESNGHPTRSHILKRN